MSISRRCLILLLCGGVVLGIVPTARSGEIDQQTRDMLETIFAGFRENRAKITDLTITGSFHEIHDQGEIKWEVNTAFKYFQSGEKRRLDETYSEDMEPAFAGRTKSLVYTGDATLAYGGWKGPEVVEAGLGHATRFQSTCKINYVDNVSLSAKWASHAELIKFLYDREDREWDPQEDDIRVDTITENNEVSLQVTYKNRSTLYGTLAEHVWVFAPERGYEVIRTSLGRYNADGSTRRKVEMVYDVREVAPGVWRGVGFEWASDHWKLETVAHAHVERQLKCEVVSANNGPMDDTLFTFEGMGLPEGAYIKDYTVEPPMTYRYSAVPFTDYEYMVSKAADLADAGALDTEEGAASAGKEEKQRPEETEEKEVVKETTAEQTAEEDAEREDANAIGESGVTPARISVKRKGTVFWVASILVISVVLGYVSRGSRLVSFFRKRDANIVVFWLVVLAASGGAKAIETHEYEDPLLLNEEMNLYRTEENICGPVSLYHSLKEIGCSASLGDIVAGVPVGLNGCSIADMCRYLEKTGAEYQVVRCDSVEPILAALRARKVAAILHTNGEKHFLAVKKGGDGRFVVLDGTHVIKENLVDGLKQRFSGRAIIVGMGRWRTMAHFMDWKRIILMIVVIPIGFGIGALVRAVLEGARRRRLVPENTLLTR